MFPKYTAQTISRFWSFIDTSRGPDACWLWTASVTRGGYGQFKVHPKSLKAHRIAWELAYGDIPDGLSVLHHCDNRRCCNPAHLWVGTHQDNMTDMRQKGRAAKGDANGSRLHPERLVRGDAHPARRIKGWSCGEKNGGGGKLTAAQVLAIRAEYAAGGVTMQSIGRAYGVDKQTIFRIVRRKGWKHI